MLRMSLDGDLASLGSLAAKTLLNVRSSPLEFKKSADTILSLNILLDGIEADSSSTPSILQSQDALKQPLGLLVNQCLISLTKLCNAIEQASVPDAALPDNITELDQELSVRYTDLSEFLNRSGVGEMTRLEGEVDGSQNQEALILQAVDKILTDENLSKDKSTIVARQNDDHTAAFRHLLVKLKLSGFKGSDVEKHKTSILHRRHEWLHLHHAASNGVRHTPWLSMSMLGTATRGHAPVRSPTMTFAEHLDRNNAANSNYRPPAASTVYDESDDDAISLGSEASTLLGPVDAHPPNDNYVLGSVTSPRPIPTTGTRRTAEPRSPFGLSSYSDEKMVAFPSSPRSAPARPWPNMTYPVQSRPPPTTATSIPRPNSPQVRVTRHNDLWMAPPRGSRSSKYDYNTLHGLRSPTRVAWRFRRPDDMYPPHEYQSMDVQDDALPTAAVEGRLNEVDRLIREGRNIESFGSRNEHSTREFYRTTALYRAARRGHFAIVHLLLRHHANPNPRREDGKSLVRLVADDGSVDILRLLLEYGADFQRQGALPQAALFGHLNVVQLLLDYGADIDEVSRQTALYRAASNGYAPIVEHLLREGANVNLQVSEHSALSKAVQHGHVQCVRLLLQFGARFNMCIGRYAEPLILLASDLGNEAIVRELLRKGASPNDHNRRILPDRRKRYPLHFAARKGHVGVARQLLHYHANPNATTDDGRGPLDIAIERGHREMIELLYDAGGEPQLDANDPVSRHYRGQDEESPRGSYQSQPRGANSSLAERPHRERRQSGLPASRSFENESKRREKSATGSRRGDGSSQHSSTSSKVGAATALLASSLMLLGGG